MSFRKMSGILLLALTTACSSTGFNRTALREAVNEPSARVTDKDIKKTITLKPQLPKPFRLAVYFSPPHFQVRRYPAYGTPHTDWRWTESDRSQFLSFVESLKQTGEIKEVFPISDAVVDGTDRKSLRLVAAQLGADALLIVNGEGEVKMHLNGWGWTYIALFPMLFAPGTVHDALFMINAAMWDVRSGFLYLTADSEGAQQQVRAPVNADGSEVLDAAKSIAITSVRDEISKRILNMDLSEKSRATKR